MQFDSYEPSMSLRDFVRHDFGLGILNSESEKDPFFLLDYYAFSAAFSIYARDRYPCSIFKGVAYSVDHQEASSDELFNVMFGKSLNDISIEFTKFNRSKKKF